MGINLTRSIGKNPKLAYHYVHYNWFVAGTFLSRTGDWFDRIALNWFVFTMTDSPFYIGVIEFCQFIPILIFSLFGGVAADRMDRRKLLIITQVGAMLSTFAISYLLLMRIHSLYLLSLFLFIRGIFLAFEIPARNALIPNLVPKEAVASAVSFFSAILNFARIAGPALAGILLAHFSIPSLILANAVSFIAVIGTLFKICPSANEERMAHRQKKVMEDIREAIDYLKIHPLILGVFVLGVVPMIFGSPYTTLMPVFAKELLHMGAEGFGMLLSAAAAGSVLCTIILGWKNYLLPKGWLLFIFILVFGSGLILFSFSSAYYLSMFLMFIVGAASMGYRIVERVIIQEEIPDEMRGRILSIVMMDAGLVPLGNVLIGWLGQYWGAVPALSFMGTLCILTTLIVALGNRAIFSIR